ncbi:MAG: hypothetical protein H7222_04295 [Methylotenera sp.]|nr:hypothetical protein [Oligoflexia bacterium]
MKNQPASVPMSKSTEWSVKLYTIIQLTNAPKHEEAMDLTAEVLADPELPESQRREFEFCKAVLLDGLGQTLEALELFVDLKKRYPLSMKYSRSVGIAARGISAQAKILAKEDPDSRVLKHFYSLLQEVNYSPHWLSYVVARQEAVEGNLKDAKAKMKGLLALSPHDEDYLSHAYQIALLTEDATWKKEIELKVERLIETCPYRLELYTTLQTHEISGSESHPEKREVNSA